MEKTETPDYKAFLTAFINKAVNQGGFNAQEASNALIALSHLEQTNAPTK